MEFLLQKVLMVLTLVHRRPSGSPVPAQLQALAQACFLALRAADTCEVCLSTVMTQHPTYAYMLKLWRSDIIDAF